MADHQDSCRNCGACIDCTISGDTTAHWNGVNLTAWSCGPPCSEAVEAMRDAAGVLR